MLDLMDIELERDINGFDRITIIGTFITKHHEQRFSKETKYLSDNKTSFKAKTNE